MCMPCLYLMMFWTTISLFFRTGPLQVYTEVATSISCGPAVVNVIHAKLQVVKIKNCMVRKAGH